MNFPSNVSTYLTFTDCIPLCKFGDCNTTIGKCICPPGHTGADCSVISMLLFFVCIQCVGVVKFSMILVILCPHVPIFKYRQVCFHAYVHILYIYVCIYYVVNVRGGGGRCTYMCMYKILYFQIRLPQL